MPQPDTFSASLPAEALERLGLPSGTPVAPGRKSVWRLETPSGPVWVKRLEEHKNPPARRVMRFVLNLLAVPALKSTPNSKGGDTLLLQNEQAQKLADAGFNTPTTIFVSRDFYITHDAGETLETLVKQPGETEDLLLAVTAELSKLHKAGFAHGRPKMRDFCVRVNGGEEPQVFILDLEERPWEVMAMSEAQARDLLLWLIDVLANRESRNHAKKVLNLFLGEANTDTLISLRRMVGSLRKVSPVVRLLASTTSSREIDAAIAAYDMLSAHPSLMQKAA